MGQLVAAIAAIGLPIAAVLYVVLQPEKAERVAGWAWSLISAAFRVGGRKAIALRVQGDVNSARAELIKDAPAGLLDSKLKINWTDADTAQAIVRDGEVLVCMRRANHHEENLAHALMAYLPRAVIPRARRYVDKCTMRAADLTLAKRILNHIDDRPGALDVFFEQHLDPARKQDEALHRRVVDLDEIDLHGWLLRVLLPEFKHLGDQLHPGDVDPRCIRDAEMFAGWLTRLAEREPGDETMPLSYEGRFIRIAVVLVAHKAKLLERGTEPYRKQAKRLVYTGDYDAVYLMGRDHNIEAVRTIFGQLRGDGRVATSNLFEYRLRSDFRKRKLDRERAAIGCLRPHHREGKVAREPDEELPEVQVERFEPEDAPTCDEALTAVVNDSAADIAAFQSLLAQDAPDVVRGRSRGHVEA
jgi:hypothetical protein